jgi:membrane dipeptidase
MTFPIVDLHCDLLFYLQGSPQRTPYDLFARCAIPQLHQGNVKIQTLAVFTQTARDSVQRGLHQVDLYQKLPMHYPKDFMHYSITKEAYPSAVATLLAFENASGFCGEGEAFSEGLKRLYQVINTIAKPLYISLTWNTENRFGGGALTRAGLKEDGKRLLEELHEKKIAVDLSHASDALAHDIINYMDGCGLDIPLMASHSNARAVTSVPRNLPDELAVEIFRRGGVVGLNFCHNFVGENEEFLLKHIAHWLELGGEDHIALGADFFYEADLPSSLRHGKDVFLPNYQNASCYGKLLNFLEKELRLNASILEKFAHKNAKNFIPKNS